MKVGILTLFKDLRSTYSLVHVVASHVSMLLDAGIKIKLLVSEECMSAKRWGVFNDTRIEWVGICNTLEGRKLEWHDYWNPTFKVHDSFEEEKEMIAKEFEKYLQDVEVCMMHDILYLGKYYVHNMAIRKAQQRLPRLKFIAFTHSYPFPAPVEIPEQMKGRYIPLPRTLYVYPTLSGISALAKQYGVPEGLCRVVYHPVPLLEGLSMEVKALSSQVDLLSPDILIVYPARLTPGKNLEKVAELAGAIKVVGEVSVQVIFCDFVSTDIDSQMYKEKILMAGMQYGLALEEMVFTSDCGFDKGLSRGNILDLFSLSNVFITPSVSESFGMTVLEAARYGNLLVMNENVTSLKELGKLLGAYLMKWDARGEGYQIIQSYEPSEAAYYGRHAKQIIDLVRGDKSLMARTRARQRFSSQWIWHHQLQPLLLENI